MSPKAYLSKAKLYLILDREICGYEKLFEILRQAVKAGVDIIQLRDKKGSSRDIINFANQCIQFIDGQIPFIINDRLDIALAVRADGVHLGQEDLPISKAREIARERMIIGASCQTLQQALKAQEEGADYIGFGSVFKTLTKPDRREMDLMLLSRVFQESPIPVFAIGGINQGNITRLTAIGVDRVAVTRAICLASDVNKAVKELLMNF